MGIVKILRKINEQFSIKLFIIFLFFISIFLFTFITFFIFQESKLLTEDLRKKGEILISLLAHDAKIGVFSESNELLKESLYRIMQHKEVLDASIFDQEGKIIKHQQREQRKKRKKMSREDNENLDKIFKGLVKSHSPVFFQKKDSVEFLAPVISSVGYATGESLFFAEEQAQEKVYTIGFVRIRMDKRSLNRKLTSLLAKSLLIGIFFLLLGSLGVYFLAQGISKPLKRLTERVRSIKTWMPVPKLPVETGDEIGKLAEAFNTMLESLEERDRNLQKIHLELEKRIKDRTAALFDANKELENKIEQRRRIEESLHVSLREKEALIRELYHRTKNNMQVIRELLYLQSLHIDDEKILEIFRDTENRIMSMALVHQKLYKSKNLSEIGLKQYIKDLCGALRDSYNICPGRISFKLEVENIFVTIDTAIPCGMVINELVSNSLKYAFPTMQDGEIKIVLQQSIDKEHISLMISDNGVGVQEGFSLKEGDTLGLKLVVNLIENQLSGTIESDIRNGLKYRIQFSEPAYKKRL
ncbi:MAG: sensor histidine kinase [bacterium]